MIQPEETETQARIADLEARGQLDPEQAETLRGAFEQKGPGPQPSAQAPEPPTPPFLQGDQPEEELRAQGRSSAIKMGIYFGVAMRVLCAIVVGVSGSWTLALLASVPGGLAMGAFYGLAMYQFLIRPGIESQIDLRRATGPLAAIQSADVGQCPTCRSEEFKVLTWKNPTLLHWILNPGLAVNELIFGQRIPARMNLCLHCKGSSVDCNNCHRAIDGNVWKGKLAFGHWQGLTCPYCKSPLPTLSNALAFVVRLPFTLVKGFGGKA